jgi:hypothetical protein
MTAQFFIRETIRLAIVLAMFGPFVAILLHL